MSAERAGLDDHTYSVSVPKQRRGSPGGYTTTLEHNKDASLPPFVDNDVPDRSFWGSGINRDDVIRVALFGAAEPGARADLSSSATPRSRQSLRTAAQPNLAGASRAPV